MKLKPEAPVPVLSSAVTRGEAVALPRPARRTEPGPPVPRKGLSPKVHPRTHGRRSDIGGKADAGDAFATWLKTEKGLDPDQRFPAGQLALLATEFKVRPVLGHRRRGTGGDNHRVNPEHLRK